MHRGLIPQFDALHDLIRRHKRELKAAQIAYFPRDDAWHFHDRRRDAWSDGLEIGANSHGFDSDYFIILRAQHHSHYFYAKPAVGPDLLRLVRWIVPRLSSYHDRSFNVLDDILRSIRAQTPHGQHPFIRVDRVGMPFYAGFGTNGYATGDVDPRWLTLNVCDLAKIVRDEDVDKAPILADALMDAGCDNERLLGTLRLSTSVVRRQAAACRLIGYPPAKPPVDTAPPVPPPPPEPPRELSPEERAQRERLSQILIGDMLADIDARILRDLISTSRLDEAAWPDAP